MFDECEFFTNLHIFVRKGERVMDREKSWIKMSDIKVDPIYLSQINGNYAKIQILNTSISMFLRDQMKNLVSHVKIFIKN